MNEDFEWDVYIDDLIEKAVGEERKRCAKVECVLQMKYFVLNPNKIDFYGAASRAAIRAYAKAILKLDTVFANDLIQWLNKIERGIGK